MGSDVIERETRRGHIEETVLHTEGEIYKKDNAQVQWRRHLHLSGANTLVKGVTLSFGAHLLSLSYT